ncbi:MAG: bifunctional oligoribonuclease/PAP phosphatase NrnA [Thermodesulfovibrionales bacterium]|nr:bifunctional oligoribonuclease/PAP phosphatase NrnA [Thermodesulfovibrionales bacterium]
MSLDIVKAFILNNDNFIIATHYNPDADTIGAGLALYQALTSIKKTSLVINKDKTPKDCQFMPHIDEVYNFDNFKFKDFSPEALIIVDCNSIKRVSMEKNHQELLSNLPTCVIDHHEISGDFGDYKWIDPNIASTTMMIYKIIKSLNIEITQDIATCLYAGLCIDTGNFRHENTSTESLQIAADLVSKGIKPSKIYRALFESWSIAKFKLFKEVIKGIEESNNIAIMTVTKEMLQRTGCDDEDAGNFVDFPKRTVYIKVSVLIKEISENKYRISMRSKNGINVAIVASQYGGGGHKNAAGCTIENNLESIKKDLFKKISEVM